MNDTKKTLRVKTDVKAGIPTLNRVLINGIRIDPSNPTLPGQITVGTPSAGH